MWRESKWENERVWECESERVWEWESVKVREWLLSIDMKTKVLVPSFCLTFRHFFDIFQIFQKSNPVGTKFTVLALEPIGRTSNPYGKPSLGFIGPFKVMSGHQEGQKLREKIMCPEIKPCQKKQNHEVQASKCISGIFPLGHFYWKLREKYGISHILSRLKSLVFFDKHKFCENGSERPFWDLILKSMFPNT